MIQKSGTRPIKKIPKKEFHRYFGGTLNVPDFNLDAGLEMQDQNADGAGTECTAYFVTDCAADKDKVIYTPDFNYAMTLFLEGGGPTTEGADPLTALQSAIAFGLLPRSQATISALHEGELMVANWQNWTPDQRALALKAAKCDVHNVLGFTDPFNSILSASWTAGLSVALATPWYKEWQTNAPTSGILPMPANPMNTDGLPWHMHAMKGKKTIGGQTYAIDKSWQGPNIGDGGYLYFSQDVLNAVMKVPGTAALIFVMSGSRFIPVVKIMLQHLGAPGGGLNPSFPYLLKQLPTTK